MSVKIFNLKGKLLIEVGKANLWEADLQGADLQGADLREADLRGTDLRRANLCNCFFHKTKISFREEVRIVNFEKEE